ncbi:MAG: T9SS type A sorting domain-containing protein [Fibrobacter sp.]|jgi:broad specificity phosphatase PhoE|nr:T9SS type A sorting domain-containing protein [Fibrobacter sp.]
MKWQSYCLSMVLCLLSAATADISVSGIVKKSDGTTGIPGVKVSLSEQNDFFSFTDSSGIFKIEGTGLRSYLPKANTIKIDLKDRILYISPIALKQNCKIGIYSVTGKNLLFKSLSQIQPQVHSLRLPHLSSGIYLIRLTLGNIELTYTLSCMGKRLFLTDHNKNIMSVPGNITVSKRESVRDTLIAEKSGYITKKVPLASYLQEDITIVLDSIANPALNKGLTVYFIRHAETVANASGQHGGDGPLEDHDTLTELGEKQVEDLKNYLIEENIRPDLVAVSPSLRTQKTIEPFLKALNIKAEIWVELNECCGDEPSGEPLPTERPEPRWKIKVEPMSESFIIASESDKYHWWPQSYEEGVFMVMTARDRLLDRFNQSGKTVMIIGHAVNGGIFLGLLRGYDMINTKPQRPVYLMNAKVNKLSQDSLSGDFTLQQNLNK